MPRYEHHLPKHPTKGYDLAALTTADGLTFRQPPWHCVCDDPRYDHYSRAGISFTEFCCACGMPSAGTSTDAWEAAKENWERCPDGYTVVRIAGGGDVREMVEYRDHQGRSYWYSEGAPPSWGEHAICAHATYLLSLRPPHDRTSVGGGERATPEEIQRAMKAAFDEHETLKGRFTFYAVRVEDKTTAIVMHGDWVYTTIDPLDDMTHAGLEAAAKAAAATAAGFIEERMAPEVCPACDGKISLCWECGGKGWLPHYKAAGVRLEQQGAVP